MAALRCQAGGAPESDAVLRQKAALYERLMRGEMSDTTGNLLVDFSAKQQQLQQQEEEGEQADAFVGANLSVGGGLVSADMRREQDRQDWLRGISRDDTEQAMRDQRRELVSEVSSRTLEARQRLDAVRKQRKTQLARRVAKLRSRQQEQESGPQAAEREERRSYSSQFELPDDGEEPTGFGE